MYIHYFCVENRGEINIEGVIDINVKGVKDQENINICGPCGNNIKILIFKQEYEDNTY
jgi:hypothetical protein